MNKKDPKLTALQFNECINKQDINGLSNLMTDGHTFIDRDGNMVKSKEAMIKSWIKFFEMFPKYKNTFIKVEPRNNLILLIGYAYWSEENPHGDAIWTAKTENGKVTEWRIYKDTKENRKILNIN
jgi:predicted SnoaL-like aldol condensation-catalyzing enzyme